MRRKLLFVACLIAVCTAAYAGNDNPLPDWAFGGFARPEGVNPLITPKPESVFHCPMKSADVKWELADTFNPAAVVKDGSIFVLYRAEDNPAAGIGGRTSRIGLVESADGLHIDKREPLPVMYPDTTQVSRTYEWDGGCEDPRVVAAVVDGKTLYVMTYTSWNHDKPRLSYAITPLLPITILVVTAIWFPEIKISVASAMIVGTVYAFVITRKNPTEAVNEFFKGMGRGYASILGIIIAAGVFAAGLRAGGLIDTFVNYLTHSNEVASLGATIGPYLMGVITGSGDAAAFAFNEAVTPHAESFGLSIPGLGYLAMMSAALGRLSSPLAGGTILLAGIACTSPMEVIKRTVPTGLLVLVVLYFVA